MAQGRDVADLPLEIANQDIRDVEVTFTDRPTEVSGDLLDAEGHPATQDFIIVFAAEKIDWTPQSRRIQSGATCGATVISGCRTCRPGEYDIGAVTDVEQGEWDHYLSFLTQLPPGSSQNITLAEGEKKVQSLKIAKRAVSRRRFQRACARSRWLACRRTACTAGCVLAYGCPSRRPACSSFAPDLSMRGTASPSGVSSKYTDNTLDNACAGVGSGRRRLRVATGRAALGGRLLREGRIELRAAENRSDG